MTAGLRLGVGVLAPLAAAPVRVAGAVRGAAPREPVRLGADLLSLLDPRPTRHQRRVATAPGRVHAEVRGLSGPEAAALGVALDKALIEVAAVTWWQHNAVTGRVSVGFDPTRCTAEQVVQILRSAEDECGTSGLSWDRKVDLPGDREPLLAAAVGLSADLVGLVVATATRTVPALPGAKALSGAVALCDAQPRLRRAAEAYLGASRTDLVITVANAAAHTLRHSTGSLCVDAGQRLVRLAEVLASREAWDRWEDRLHGPDRPSLSDRPVVPARPCPLPPGPVEGFADRAAAGSLVAAGLSLMGGRNLDATAEAVLAGVPKASRAARESFAGALSVSLSKQGILTLDSGVWRRLDRVDALIVDAEAIRSQVPVVLEARTGHPGWTVEQVWSAGQRLLPRAPGSRGPGRPIPPPGGKTAANLRLSPDLPGPDSGPRWARLEENGAEVGRVLIGREPHPRADGLLAAARRAGLRVVLAGERPGSELAARADELIAPGASLSAGVQRLQQDGHVVAVLSVEGHRALMAADVALGLVTRDRQGRARLSWGADVLSEDLAALEAIIAATRRARAVSVRGRTLARSASALSGLLLVSGPRRGLWYQSLDPVTGAALVGLLTGARAGWVAGRVPPQASVPLAPWHCLEADEALSRLPDPAPGARSATGLPAGDLSSTAGGPAGAAVARVLRAAPQVAVPVQAAVSVLGYLRGELADPLTPVLSVGAGASAILGAPTDAVLVGSVMGVNALVSALQRRRADQAMDALRAGEQVLAHRVRGPHARTPGGDPTSGRDLVEDLLPAQELRPGEVIVLRPGDVVPADARLLAARDLEVDESGLTGESVTVAKHPAATPGAGLGERACMVHEGSTVTAGRGRALVVAVGEATAAGRALAAIPPGPGSGGVQAQLRALTDKALPLTLLGGALVTGLGLARGQRARAAVADGVAVAVAAVPEGLPLVATVAQLAAARRLSRRGVLVRTSRTVEALGRVDTMCFDKTGTLTEGRLSLAAIADLTGVWTEADLDTSPAARRVLRCAARACPDPDDGPVHHATDRAVLEAARAHPDASRAHPWESLEEVPFQSNRGYAATLGQSDKALRLMVKGAPEVLLPRCTNLIDASPGPGQLAGTGPLTAAGHKAALAVIHTLAAQGLRVLLVARRELTTTPEDLDGAVDQLTLIGFVGIADQPRAATEPVIRALGANGISVRMITGDHPVTAAAIAAQLGIACDRVVTGADLDALDETTRTELINSATVFARVSPEHKVQIVAALQRGGHVVGMTGDGSNDAAAIRLADVGIGLEAHGSAAARNAADLVLTRTDLTLILEALVEGRMMWQRVRDAVAILVGGNAGEVAFTILGTALAGRAPVGTRQFLLVNLLTDMFPAMAVALAQRPQPAPAADDPLEGAVEVDRAQVLGTELAGLPTPELGQVLLRSIAIRGAATATGAGSAWLIGRTTGTPRRAATMGLAALVGTQLGQTVLLGGRSPLVSTTAVASAAALVAVVQTPGVSQFFGCTPLDPLAWTVVVTSSCGATLASVVVPALVPRARTVSDAVLQRSPGFLQEAVVGLQHQMTRRQ